jgi:hypothetical protein
VVPQIQIEGLLHLSGLTAVHDKAAAVRIDVVPEHRVPADPLALLPRRRHLVARPLRDEFAFKLREGEQDVQGQPAKGTRRVELLRDGHEADATPVKRLHQLGEVEQRSAQAVDLVDHHAVDSAGLHCGQQPGKRGPIHVGAGVAAVVKVLRDQAPAFVPLAGDVSSAASRWASRELKSCSSPSSVDFRV